MAWKGVVINFNTEIDVLLYLHDKGEEYYLHYDFWPIVPFVHEFKQKEAFADIVVRKELEVQNENCHDETYDYFGNYILLIALIRSITFKL